MKSYILCLIAHTTSIVFGYPHIRGSVVNSVNIPLFSCCGKDQFYMFGIDSCDDDTKNDNQWPLLKVQPNQRTVRTILSTDKPLQVPIKMTNCTDGSVVATSRDFTFYEDGTLALTGSGKRLLPEDFCLNPARTNDFNNAVWIARFCVPDPCQEGGCIRKCCPDGMAMNITINECQLYDREFRTDVSSVIRESESDVRSYAIRTESVPRCKAGIYLLNPYENENDKFHILPDGRLYQWDISTATNDYCVENFIDENHNSQIHGLVCFDNF